MRYHKWLLMTSLLVLLFTEMGIAQIEIGQGEEKYEFREVPLSENARIEFDHTTFNFGALNKGASVAHSYWFTNNGSDTLIITKIKPTCGCTSTKKGGITAAPGESASIDIIFNTGKFNGRVTKAIKLETNDKLNPYMDIRFKSTINDPQLKFNFIPFEADYKTVPAGKAETFKITITNTDSTKSNLEIVDLPLESFIKAKLSKSSLKPEESVTLTFTLQKDIEPGEYLSSITLEDTNKKHSRFSIPITVKISE